jgi:hypothetical protein
MMNPYYINEDNVSPIQASVLFSWFFASLNLINVNMESVTYPTVWFELYSVHCIRSVQINS